MDTCKLFFVIGLVFFIFPEVIRCHENETETDSKFSDNVSGPSVPPPVTLQTNKDNVVLDNGILQVILSSPGGSITGIQYKGITNLLEWRNEEDDRGYYDIVWSNAGGRQTSVPYYRLKGSKFSVIKETRDQAEVSFVTTWDPTSELAPLNVDKRYVMLRGSSGFYSYVVFEHDRNWPAFQIAGLRIAFKLDRQMFRYMAISDKRQRYMPMPEDRQPGRSEELAYAEAVLLVNPMEPQFKGEVDDKYQYSETSENIKVHGWISPSSAVGFWQINPSNEFISGGPTKQYLTSHVGPTTLASFHSSHYMARNMTMQFVPDEPWTKLYGPVFLYVNSLPGGGHPISLWKDAKNQMEKEVQGWPYNFPASPHNVPLTQRGQVFGRLLVHDRYVTVKDITANGAYVGLARPGAAGSWQTEGKGYQFWTRADEQGMFSIKNIRPGSYNLYAWVPGFIGDYVYSSVLNITRGDNFSVGDLVFYPRRQGPTIWEIGIPDRSALEFFIPKPNLRLLNKLYVNETDDRQYGLWERYTEIYKNSDLVFTVGLDDYTKDWFYAQVPRKIGENKYIGTSWEIRFNIGNVEVGCYQLQLAFAAAQYARLQVRVNNPTSKSPIFYSGRVGSDNSIARHGIHGFYRLFSVTIPSKALKIGTNSIFLRIATQGTIPFQGIMYDYIRLEGPPKGGSECQISWKLGYILITQIFVVIFLW